MICPFKLAGRWPDQLLGCERKCALHMTLRDDDGETVGACGLMTKGIAKDCLEYTIWADNYETISTGSKPFPWERR